MRKKAGAKPRYETPELMQKVIDDYFDQCGVIYMRDEEGSIVRNKIGEPIVLGNKPPTVTGLALALGFSTRKSLLDYQEKPAFVNTVTRAKSRCEEYAEQRLYDRDGQRGAEFSLRCNFKWNPQPEEEREAEPMAGYFKAFDAARKRYTGAAEGATDERGDI